MENEEKQLDIYNQNIDDMLPNITSLLTVTTRIGYAITVAQKVTKNLKKADETADKVDKGLVNTDNVLTVLKFVSPLKTPVNLLKKVVDKTKKPVDKIDDKFDELSGKDDAKTPQKEEENEFLDKLEANLGTAAIVVDGVKDTLNLLERRMEIAQQSTEQYQDLMEVALRPGVVWSGRYDNLDMLIETQLGLRNGDIETNDVDGLYAQVKLEVDGLMGTFDDIGFDNIFDGFVKMDDIRGIFDFLEKPLDIAASIIEPIQPLLNAVDALVSLIIDPIIDFVTETLGIDKLIDEVQAQIDKLLPPIEFLDALAEFAQKIKDLLFEYTLDALGTIPFLDLVEQAFFGSVVGEADQGTPETSPTGWGNAVGNTLRGDDGDDILVALEGRDTILGFGGNDVIMAGAGSDSIDGGAGDDLIYFDASFTEYQISRDRETDEIIVSHLQPSGTYNTGIDRLTLDDDDQVVFTDISFSGQELNNAVIGVSVLNGDRSDPDDNSTGDEVERDDLIFLNYGENYNPNSSNPQDREPEGDLINGFFVANGFKGDDRIFGSVLNDQLNGGPGNDTLYPGQGDDEVNGGSGFDTFQVLEGANSQLRIDLMEGTAIGQGQDTLTSIENVVAAPNQKHKIKGTDGANAIFTADGIDVVAGFAGNDVIDGGGENDFLVGGEGSDLLVGGADRDVLISGSGAVAGVSDYYVGGDGTDTVAYTKSSNTIKFDIQDESDDPSILQTLKNYMEDIVDETSVEIDGKTGIIRRFDANGTFVATDYTEDVEQFVGSDQDDVLLGGPIADLLHGAGGNDIIRTGGTENIDGGDGDDTIFAEQVDGGSTALQIEGGSGFDILDLEGVDDARWYYKVQSAISLTLRAHETTVEGEDLRNARDVFFSIKPRGVEQISLGNFADHAIYEPGGTQTSLFFLKDGNDRFDAENGFADVDAGEGDDIGNFDGGGGGIFRGGNGNDRAVFDDNDRDNQALMGADQDYVEIERFKGHADGGEGYDTIAFDVSFSSRIVADLEAGTVESFKGVSTNVSEQVDMTLTGFEELIATEFNDTIDGSDGDEQIIARGGNDVVRSEGGRDKLFGGSGTDQLFGGEGDDLLHGGTGNDILNGGNGTDTASYAWVRPGGLQGELLASNFSGVNVTLGTGSANGSSSGTFGIDTLISIENIFGSGGDDDLTGNNEDNTLSGGAGNDELRGNGGNDVLVTGRGNDIVFGGSGDDTVVIGIGNKTLSGGDGIDTLDFGTVDGDVTIDFNNGTYDGTFLLAVPRWLQRDLDGDGIEESNGTEARLFNGAFLTPQDVFEADPQNSNSNDDLTRPLPGEDDEDFEAFLITTEDVSVGSFGSFTGFEKVVGGVSGATIMLTSGTDVFDGRNSLRDVIDLSTKIAAISYNFQTGANNIAELAGDTISGIEGLFGGLSADAITGDNAANIFSGGFGNDTLKGSGGADELHGDEGNDFVRGGFDNDMARGGADDDKVYGDAGDDELYGDEGDDELFGGTGDDMMDGGEGMDLASYRFAAGGVDVDLRQSGRDVGGGEGKDTFMSIENLEGSQHEDILSGNEMANKIMGGAMRDVIYGQEGEDVLMGGEGADSLRGGLDNDMLMGEKGNDFLIGNIGDDELDGGTGDDMMDGGAGFDTVSYASASAGIYADLRFGGRDVGGGQGRDSFTSIEHLKGSGHNDRLGGDSGNNKLMGGDGDDIIKGFGGNDTYEGGAGNDRMIGSSGNDVMLGGDGDDILFALSGMDDLQGEAGDDFLSGGRDADTMSGGTGADRLRGNLGDDLMLGGDGADDLRGGGNTDTMDGGDGNDFLFGDNGADRIDGGTGDDVLRGGISGSAGDGFRDVFIFGENNGMDRIRDFENGLDTLDLSALGFDTFDQVRDLASNRTSGLKLEFSEGNEVFIDGMSLALFTAGDVVLS